MIYIIIVEKYVYTAGIIDTWQMNCYKGIQGIMLKVLINNL